MNFRARVFARVNQSTADLLRSPLGLAARRACQGGQQLLVFAASGQFVPGSN